MNTPSSASLVTDAAITLPGQVVSSANASPGDFLVGDGNGLIVIPRAIAAQVIGRAGQLAEIEQGIQQLSERGASREESLVQHPRFKHTGRLKT